MDAVFRRYVATGGEPKRTVTIGFRQAGEIDFPVGHMVAATDRQTLNNCCTQIGQVHRAFNIEPENYGHTVQNVSLSFFADGRIVELLVRENWRNLPVTSTEYGDDEDNISDVVFRGLIQRHPSLSGDTISSVQVESIESIMLQKKISSYVINSVDWTRCPQTNVGKRAPIIMGTNTIEKPLICVDGGAYATIIEHPDSLTVYDEESEILYVDSLSHWELALIKPRPYVRLGRELMRILVYDVDAGRLEVVRGENNTDKIVPTAGMLIIEYRPRQTYLLTQHTVGTGQTYDIIAINPDDTREQYLVPSSWYTSEYNKTVGGETLTYVNAHRAINKGFFASTLNIDLPMKTSQDGVYPDNTLEPLISVSTATGYSAAYLEDLPYKQFTRALTSDMVQVLYSEGWTNPLAMLGDTPDYAEFNGTPKWDVQQLVGARLYFHILSLFGQTGAVNIQTPSTTEYLKAWANFYPLQNTITDPWFFYYGGLNETDPISCTGYWSGSSSYLGYSHRLYQQYSGQINRGYEGSTGGYRTINMANWADIDRLVVTVKKQEWWTMPSVYQASPPWETAHAKIQNLTLTFMLRTDPLFDVANMSDGNLATFAYINGVFSPAWGTGYAYPTTFTRRWVSGSGGWPAQPDGNIVVTSKYVTIKFRCNLTNTNPDEHFSIFFTANNGVSGNTYDLKTSTYNPTPGADVTLQLSVPFDANNGWSSLQARIYSSVGYYATPPIRIYSMALTVNYYTDASKAETSSLWTDNEDLAWAWAGALCGDLQSDGPASYAWLKYKTNAGLYYNKDGVLACPVHSQLEDGLVTRVWLQITHQINEAVDGVGGCSHRVDSVDYPAAWAWYGYLNARNGNFTGTAGAKTIAQSTFTDAEQDFEDMGVLAGDVLYLFTGLDQGSYVISSAATDTLTISATETRKWDIGKESWTAWVQTASDVPYRIYRPHTLLQSGQVEVERFDITDQIADWDTALDFANDIMIRGHLKTDAAAGDPAYPANWPYYDGNANKSLFRAWMPKLLLEYNSGKESVIVAKGFSGVDSGEQNPVDCAKWLLETEGGMAAADFDLTTWTAAAVNRDHLKVDYSITDGTLGDALRDLTFFFGWSIQWHQQAIARTGSTPRALSGWKITDEEDDDVLDYYPHSNAVKSPLYGTEADATTGWSSLGTTLSSEAGSLWPYRGSYRIRAVAGGGAVLIDITGITAPRYDGLEIELSTQSSVRNTSLNVQCISTSFRSGWNVYHNETIIATAKPGGNRHCITLPALTGQLTQIRITNTTLALNDYVLFDTLTIRKPSSTVAVKEPLYPVSYGTIGKWGPLHTAFTLFYAIKSWSQVDELVAGTSSKNAKSLTSQGSAFYDALVAAYGELMFPEKMSRLRPISDHDTAMEFGAWIQRFTSERVTITGMDLGPRGRILETGDVIYIDTLRYYPHRFRSEFTVEKWFQVLSTDGAGTVDLIEVNDSFSNALL